MESNINNHLSENAISYIAIKTLTILENFHSKGYIHRDIKPTNFVKDANNNIYMIDFGLAYKYLGK